MERKVNSARTRVAVVIPCFRVARHIAGVIRSVPAAVSDIILVDDASPDEVVAEAMATGDPRLRVLRHAHNRGVGGAMVTGYQEALRLGADVIVKVDGDGQMDLTQLPALVEPLLKAEADYTKGNRWCHTAALARMPWRRRWGNLLLSFATKMVSGYWRVFDPCNGYTAIRASTLRLLGLENVASGYFFETSMLVELAIERATVRDVFLPSIYGEEKSSMRLGRILLGFPPALLRACLRRVYQRYFVRSFEACSVFLVAGLMLCAGSTVFGATEWIRSARTGIPSTTGSVMLAVLPFLMGFHLLLQAIVLDIGDQPSVPRCQGLLITPVTWSPEHREAA